MRPVNTPSLGRLAVLVQRTYLAELVVREQVHNRRSARHLVVTVAGLRILRVAH